LSRDPVAITTPMKDTKGILREAHTDARVIATCEDPRCSLVLATPRTGRFHQIRRHLRDLSHPVLGDGVHGDSRVNRWWRENRGLGRLALHNLSLVVPAFAIDVRCPIPTDLRAVWSALPLWQEAVAALPELDTS
jgi:tRNA pseudouridine65 synthase